MYFFGCLRCGQHRIDHRQRASAQVVILHPVVVLEVSDKRLYGGPALGRMALPPALQLADNNAAGYGSQLAEG